MVYFHRKRGGCEGHRQSEGFGRRERSMVVHESIWSNQMQDSRVRVVPRGFCGVPLKGSSEILLKTVFRPSRSRIKPRSDQSEWASESPMEGRKDNEKRICPSPKTQSRPRKISQGESIPTGAQGGNGGRPWATTRTIRARQSQKWNQDRQPSRESRTLASRASSGSTERRTRNHDYDSGVGLSGASLPLIYTITVA